MKFRRNWNNFPLKKDWTPEITITCEMAGSLIEKQFPDFLFSQIDLLGSGFDNQAFLIDNQWIFRFPRRDFAAHFIETENIFLPLICESLSLEIPFPQYIGKPDESYPWSFSGYRKISGKTGCQIFLNSMEKLDCARKLGIFLRQLHSIDPVKEKFQPLPRDSIRRFDIPYRIQKFSDKWNQIHQLGIFPWFSEIQCFLEEVSHPPMIHKECLIHGDLYARHLIFQNNELSGIIDWGDMHQGYFWWDLAIIYGFFTPSQREVFEKYYGPISPEAERLARFADMNRMMALFLYSIDVKDTDAEKMSISCLKNQLSELIPHFSFP